MMYILNIMCATKKMTIKELRDFVYEIYYSQFASTKEVTFKS